MTHIGLCLVIALAGSLLASALGVPLPFMLGSVAATMIAALLRWPIVQPGPVLVLPMRVVLGVLIGSTISPEMLTHARAILGAVVCVPVYVFVSSALSMWYYHRVAGFSRDEAFFAGLPGGLYAMTAFAEDAGVGIRRVTICHTLRVALVVMLIPIGVEQYLGGEIGQATLPAASSLTDLSLWDVGLLITSALLGVVLGRASGLPGGLIFGPMIITGLFHVTGLSTTKPPVEIALVAQVVLGASIGARFVGEELSNIRRVAGYTLVHVMLTLLLSVAFSVLVVQLLGLPPVTSVIGFAPGGLMEMTLVALGLNIDVGVVATLHLTRVITILLLAPVIYRVASGGGR